LFSILKNIEQDGTFNQLKPISTLLEGKPSYLASFDLSAATDRLPIKFQVDLLSQFMGKEFSEA